MDPEKKSGSKLILLLSYIEGGLTNNLNIGLV